MAHDVFISYSSKDKPIADAVCGTLEGKRIRCWIAPRDVLPGLPYGEALVEAIESSRVMVLVFSSNANNSPQVMREVERAVSKGMPIIPLRIEQVLPAKSLKHFISSLHWLDALTPPLEKHLRSLAETVHLLLDQQGERRDSREGENGSGLGTVEEIAGTRDHPSTQPSSRRQEKSRPVVSKGRWGCQFQISIVLGLLVTFGVATFFFLRAPNSAPPTTFVASKHPSRLPIEWTRYPSSEMWESKLKQIINYGGVDDPRITLDEELENLAKQYGLKFKIDDVAFKCENIVEVGKTEIASPAPIPKMNVSIAEVIQTILKRIPAPSGACYQIRNDHILITTPYFQRVTVETTVESLPLWEFLDYLSDNFGYGIDRTFTKDKENKLIKVVATKDVYVHELVGGVLRQVDVDPVAAQGLDR
jgi:hypothetical protein